MQETVAVEVPLGANATAVDGGNAVRLSPDIDSSRLRNESIDKPVLKSTLLVH
jgi:hypothetical protein